VRIPTPRSYDNTVRLFDTRKLLTPLTQAEVGGGAWRVKWHPAPSRAHDLLVAAMHGGFKVLRFRDVWTNVPNVEREHWEILRAFDRHESLAYGVDWSHAPSRDSGEAGQTLIASASFYDHAMHVWRA
jgi:diphthamide biosynthesis protein 7